MVFTGDKKREVKYWPSISPVKNPIIAAIPRWMAVKGTAWEKRTLEMSMSWVYLPQTWTVIVCSWRLNTLACGILVGSIPSHPVRALWGHHSHSLFSVCILDAFENDVNINFLWSSLPKAMAFLLPLETNAKALSLPFQGELRALKPPDFHPGLELQSQIYLPFAEEPFCFCVGH